MCQVVLVKSELPTWNRKHDLMSKGKNFSADLYIIFVLNCNLDCKDIMAYGLGFKAMTSPTDLQAIESKV